MESLCRAIRLELNKLEKRIAYEINTVCSQNIVIAGRAFSLGVWGTGCSTPVPLITLVC